MKGLISLVFRKRTNSSISKVRGLKPSLTKSVGTKNTFFHLIFVDIAVSEVPCSNF